MLGVGAEGRSRVGDGLIDPEAIPGKNIDAAGIESAADDLAAASATIPLAGENVVSSWGGLPAVYVAPEADDLYAVMASVGTDTVALDEVLSKAAAAIETLAADAATIVSKLETIRSDAVDFVTEARDGYVVDFWDPNHPNWDKGWFVGLATDFADMKPARIRWDQYTPAVERNAELIGLVDAQVVALSEAEAECADAINALRTDTCVPSVVPVDREALDARGTRPWGDPDAADRSCYESAGDGFAGAADAAAHGALALVGLDLDAFLEDPVAYSLARLGVEIGDGQFSWSPETAAEAWGETGALAGSTLGEAALSLGAIALIGPVVPLVAATVPSGPLGDAARAIQERQAAVAEGLIGDAESWQKDPAEAFGALGSTWSPLSSRVAGS